MEQRALLEVKRAVLGTVDFSTGKVGGQQVRGELNAVKITFDGFAECLDRPGFGQPRGAFDQQVTICQQCNNESINQGGLAQYLLADPLPEL